MGIIKLLVQVRLGLAVPVCWLQLLPVPVLHVGGTLRYVGLVDPDL